MKIGFYSPYLHAYGGGERYFLTIAEHFSAKHQVDIFTNITNVKKESSARLSINLDKVKIVNNVFENKGLEKIIKTSNYDIFFFLSDGSLPFSLAKMNVLHFQRPFPNLKLSVWGKLKISKFQKIICNSYFTKKYIDKEYSISSTVIWPPVDVDKFKSNEKRNIILSIGRFSPLKKQDMMIECFKEIEKKIPGWELYLVGGLLESEKNYFDKLRTLSKGTRIRLLTNESFSNLQKYYSEAKIYWHAAGFAEDENKFPQNMEHFGISTVESMSAGCIPIVYNGGGQREIIEDSVDGFLWQKKEDLIKLTLDVINSNNLSQIRDKAIEKARLFSKEKFLQKIDDLIIGLSK